MVLESSLDLNKIIETIGIDTIIIIDNNGDLVNSLNIDYGENIAAMTEVVFSMCKDLSKDLNNGSLEQLMMRTTEGFLIANKVGTDHIVATICKDHSKLGLTLKKMNSIETII